MPVVRRLAGIIDCMDKEEMRQQYALLQYQSLRDECSGARTAQYTILQWSQAVSGTLFAAALVTGASKSERFVIAAQFIFGLVIPALLLGGGLAWAGEMIRMERTGVYLRTLERAIWVAADQGEFAGTSMFIWENILWSPPEKFNKAGYRKQNTGYAGAAIFFGMMFIGSLIAFCILSQWWLSLVVCAALILLGVTTMIPPAIQIFSLGGAAPTVTNADLIEWISGLDDAKSASAQSGALQWIRGTRVTSLRKPRTRNGKP